MRWDQSALKPTLKCILVKLAILVEEASWTLLSLSGKLSS